MPDFSWFSRSPLQNTIAIGSNARRGTAGMSLTEVRDFELVQIMARRGKWPEVAAAATACFGTTPPDKPVAATARGAVLVWSGPDQFLTLSKSGGNTVGMLRPTFEASASLSDLSSGRVLVRVSGMTSRAMLAKVSSVDLDNRAFPIGTAAATSIDHAGVNMWRGLDTADSAPAFYVLILASYADSIWHALVDASAEYGVEVLASSFDIEAAASTWDLRR